MNDKSKFNINDFQDGVLADKVAEKWQELLQNMQNPNMPYKPTRKLVITLSCVQNEHRTVMGVTGGVDLKLAPEAGVGATFSAGSDLETGEAWAEEYKPLDARQVTFEELSVGDDGEILEDEGTVNKIIDMKNAR